MTSYNPKYSKKNEERRRARYHMVNLNIEKTYYDEVLRPAADREGVPVGTFIKNAIREKIENATEI